MAENRRPWFVVAATATVLGVGGLVAVGTASADVELNDQQAPAQVQLVDHAQQQAGGDLDDSPESADSPAASAVDSPADRADDTANTANTPTTPVTPATPDTAATPTPSSADTPN